FAGAGGGGPATGPPMVAAARRVKSRRFGFDGFISPPRPDVSPPAGAGVGKWSRDSPATAGVVFPLTGGAVCEVAHKPRKRGPGRPDCEPADIPRRHERA